MIVLSPLQPLKLFLTCLIEFTLNYDFIFTKIITSSSHTHIHMHIYHETIKNATDCGFAHKTRLLLHLINIRSIKY